LPVFENPVLYDDSLKLIHGLSVQAMTQIVQDIASDLGLTVLSVIAFPTQEYIDTTREKLDTTGDTETLCNTEMTSVKAECEGAASKPKSTAIFESFLIPVSLFQMEKSSQERYPAKRRFKQQTRFSLSTPLSYK
jgi:hypothetical protein